MGIFGGNQGEISDDKPEADGKVVIDIKVFRIDRSTREVKTVVVERSTGESVYRSKYIDKESKGNYGAYNKALEIAEMYCTYCDYIADDVLHNVKDIPVIRTSQKRSR